MHQTHSTPELTLAAIALDIDAPPAPPIAPTDPHDAIAACLGYRARAVLLLQQAQTPTERLEAELWIDNAERNIAKWQRAAERSR